MRSFSHRITPALAVVALVFAVAPALAATASKPSSDGVVNVNTASAAELEHLPGVGPSLARRIVEHRQKNGAFQAPEDLLLVRGIGEKSFERLRPYVALSGATTLDHDVPSSRRARPAKKPVSPAASDG
jgi:competence protein ComEA